MASESSSVRAALPLVAAIVGAGLTVWGFLAGIDSALNGGGSGPSPVFLAMFFVGAALVLVALVWSIVRLARGRSRVLSALALVVSLLPIAAVVILRLAAVSAS